MLLTEAKKITGIPTDTLRDWIKKGHLKYSKRNKRYHVSKKELVKTLQKAKRKGGPKRKIDQMIKRVRSM